MDGALFPPVFLAALVIMAAVQSAVTRIGSRRGAEDLRLDASQAAYLAGGRRRVVDAAIAGLAMRDLLAVSRRGRLTPVAGAVADPVDQAVHEAAHGSRASVYRRVRSHPAVRAVEAQVRSRALVLTGPRAALWWTVRLLPVALAAVGLASALTDLTIMLVALAVPLFWVLFGRSSPHYRPTPLGRAVLLRLQKRYRVDDMNHGKYLEQERAHGREPEPWDTATAVGVRGFAAIPNTILRAALVRSRGPATGGDGE